MTNFIQHPRVLSPYDDYLCEFSLFQEQLGSPKYPQGSLLIKTITLLNREHRAPFLSFSVGDIVLIRLVKGNPAPAVVKKIKFDRRGFDPEHNPTFDDLKIKVEWVYSQKQRDELSKVQVEQHKKEKGYYTSNHSDKVMLGCVDGMAPPYNIVGHIKFQRK